jgi:hypothetical protein
MPNKKSQQEGVIIIFDEIKTGDRTTERQFEPAYIVRKNGEVVYYKLEKMSFGDHAEMLGADVAQK